MEFTFNITEDAVLYVCALFAICAVALAYVNRGRA